MCPVCIATAALLAASVTGTGGLAALAVITFGRKQVATTIPAPPESKEDRHG
jgi:hypothetical protein